MIFKTVPGINRYEKIMQGEHMSKPGLTGCGSRHPAAIGEDAPIRVNRLAAPIHGCAHAGFQHPFKSETKVRSIRSPYYHLLLDNADCPGCREKGRDKDAWGGDFSEKGLSSPASA